MQLVLFGMQNRQAPAGCSFQQWLLMAACRICGLQIGMMFVRCRGGVSHSPEEYVADEDVAASVAALYAYLQKQLL
jgi:acetylornithine deacetylase/succinyl-diaminopimelate desuccinylase-like protein